MIRHLKGSCCLNISLVGSRLYVFEIKELYLSHLTIPKPPAGTCLLPQYILETHQKFHRGQKREPKTLKPLFF